MNEILSLGVVAVALGCLVRWLLKHGDYTATAHLEFKADWGPRAGPDGLPDPVGNPPAPLDAGSAG